jgi:hypothetical protein
MKSRVTLHCRPSCRNLVNCAGQCRVEMLHYYVADGFGCAVHETKSHQLRRMPVDGKEKWSRQLCCLVVVQQPGIQELTNSVRLRVGWHL